MPYSESADGIELKTYDSEEIYQELRRRILTGRYHPGQKLSENSLADEFACSRTPMRETLKRLESDGLVGVRPKSGTYVRNETERDVINQLQVRAYLESLAFSLCMEKITIREINRIERLKKLMDRVIQARPTDMLKYANLHYEFHFSIVKGSKNDLLIRTYERLHLRYSHMFYLRMDDISATDTQNEHAEILRLLRERNPAGEDFMKIHLFNVIGRRFKKT